MYRICEFHFYTHRCLLAFALFLGLRTSYSSLFVRASSINDDFGTPVKISKASGEENEYHFPMFNNYTTEFLTTIAEEDYKYIHVNKNNICEDKEEKQPNKPIQKIIPLRSINHLSIDARDVEKSKSFYKSILGFEEVYRPNLPFGGAWLRLPHFYDMGTSDDGQKVEENSHRMKVLHPDYKEDYRFLIHIIERDPTFENVHAVIDQAMEEVKDNILFIRRGRHTAFNIVEDDLEEMEKRLINHGIDFIRFGIPDGSSTSSQIFFYDPDYNGIEIGIYPKI